MASFDIKSLFTNIPLTETLNLWINFSNRNQIHAANFTKTLIYNLLKITTFESFFGDVAMDSLLGPTSVFSLSYFGNILLKNCPPHFKQTVYRQFIDDIFSLLIKRTRWLFKNLLNNHYKKMKFKFASSVYCSGIFTNCES